MPLGVTMSWKGRSRGTAGPTDDCKGSCVCHGHEAKDAECHVRHSPEAVSRNTTVVKHGLGVFVSTRFSILSGSGRENKRKKTYWVDENKRDAGKVANEGDKLVQAPGAAPGDGGAHENETEPVYIFLPFNVRVVFTALRE